MESEIFRGTLTSEDVVLAFFHALANLPETYEEGTAWWFQFLPSLFFTSTLICTTLLLFMVYVLVRLTALRKAKIRSLRTPASISVEESKFSPSARKWQRVEDHIASANPGDWRLAIFEADILLDELLDELGIYGDSVGEKLKKAPVSQFPRVQDAWEAHKMRNALAHEGADFLLSEREAKHVVGLYEQIFRELGFI